MNIIAEPLPLWAAADWLEIAFFLFIVVSSLLGQALKVMQDRKKKGRAARPADVPPPVNAPAGGEEKSSLEKEIEQFLKRTSDKPKSGRQAELDRGEQSRPGTSRQPHPARPKPQSDQRYADQRQSERRPPAQRRPVQAKVAKPNRPITPTTPPPVMRGETVAEHVQDHLRSGDVTRRSGNLAQRLSQADERIEEHLHDVFDHRLGSLSQSGAENRISEGTDAAAWELDSATMPGDAEQILKMLSSPRQVGNAIVLAEILRRPEDRWDRF